MMKIERFEESPCFISLKWKVGLIVSLVLIVVNSLITLAAYRQSNLQFNERSWISCISSSA